jgi:hypothetical protein
LAPRSASSAILAALVLGAPAAQAQAWLDGYSFRAPVTVTSASGLTDYQVLVTLDTASLVSAGQLGPSCGDLRFTGSDGVTLLPHWVESGCGSATTRTWVRAPALDAGATTLFAYFGAPDAGSASDPNATNLFYDDFSADPNTNLKWSNIFRYAGVASDEFVWGNGELWLTTVLTSRGGGGTFMTMDPAWDDSWALSFWYRAGEGAGPNDGGDGLAFGFFHAGNAGNGNELGVANLGYAVEVDALLGAGDPSPEHVAVVHTVTGNNGFNHLVWYNTPKVKDDAWHLVLVGFNASRITVDLDDAGILDFTGSWVRTNRSMLFGAGTGNDTDLHRIDNVVLRKFVRPEPAAVVGTVFALDAGAPADGGADGGSDGGTDGGATARLELVLPQTELPAGRLSALIGLRLLDGNGDELHLSTDLAVTLGSSSARGGFVQHVGDTPMLPFHVTVPAGTSATGVYYQDDLPGVATLTASAPGFETGTAAITVSTRLQTTCGCETGEQLLLFASLALLLRRRR